MARKLSGSFTCRLTSEAADILRARGLAPKIDEDAPRTTPSTYKVSFPDSWTIIHWPIGEQFLLILVQGQEVVGSAIAGEELVIYRRI